MRSMSKYLLEGKKKGGNDKLHENLSTFPKTTSVERSRSWTMARLATNSDAAVKYKFGMDKQSDTASFVFSISSGVDTVRLGNLNAWISENTLNA